VSQPERRARAGQPGREAGAWHAASEDRAAPGDGRRRRVTAMRIRRRRGTPLDLNRWLSAGVDAIGGWQASFGAVEPHPSLQVSDEQFAAAFGGAHRRLRDNYPFFHRPTPGRCSSRRTGSGGRLPDHDADQPEQPRPRRRPGHGPDGERGPSPSWPRMFGLPRHLGHLTTSGTIATWSACTSRANCTRGAAWRSARRRTTPTAGFCGVLGIEGTAVGVDAAGRIDPGRAGRAADRRPHRHGGGHGRDDRAGRDRPGARGAGRGPPARRPGPRRRGLRRLLHPAGRAGRASRRDPAPWPGHSRSATRSSSTPRTSTASSPTAAAPCCSQTRTWSGCTSTTRRTPTSPPDELHLGEISLECSRAGAAAAALC